MHIPIFNNLDLNINNDVHSNSVNKILMIMTVLKNIYIFINLIYTMIYSKS